MSLERLEQQLQTLPQWPQLRTCITTPSNEYGLWEDLTQLIIEIETTDDVLDWASLLEPGEHRFEESAKQAYLRAALAPVARELFANQEYIERYCMLEWFNSTTPTICFSMAQTLMLEAYEVDENDTFDEDDVYRLLNMAELTDKFLAIPELTDLRNLEIFNAHSTEHIVRMLQEAQMPNLKSLVISCPMTGELIGPLLEALSYEQLQHLTLSFGVVTEDWQPPQATMALPELTSLYLTLFGANEVALRQVLSQTCFEHLTSLHMTVTHPHEEPTDDDAYPIPNILNVLGQPLTCSPETVLADYQTGLKSPNALIPMAESNALGGIASLTTSGWVATIEGLEAIVQHATALTSLNLFNASITDNHIGPLLQATTLEMLGLDHNLIGPQGAHQLATSPLMKTLIHCSINHNLISVQNIYHLVNVYGPSYKNNESQAFGELRSLLQNEPSSENWSTLCERLNTWQDTPYLHEVVLPYLLDHLAQWPDELCTLPQQWSVQLNNGYNIPCLPIVRALTLGYDDYTTNREILGQELAQTIDQFKGIKHLYVDHTDAQALLHILASPVAQHLTTFEMTQELHVRSDPTTELHMGGDLNLEPSISKNDDEPGHYLELVIQHLTKLPELETLHLNGQYLQETHLNTLSNSTLPGQLKTLKLEHNTIVGIENLSVDQTTLTTLSLCDSFFDESDLQTFFHGNLFSNLTQLDLSMVSCDDMSALIDALIDNSRLNNLQRLLAAGIAQDDTHRMQQLFRANRLPNLTYLDLSDQVLQVNTIEALVSSGIFAQLKTLRANWTNLPAEAFHAITQSPGQLEHLSWGGNQVDAQGLKQMVDAPWASTIQSIDFSECQSINTVDMLTPVLMATTFTQLKTLTLYNDALDMDALQKLDRTAMNPAAQKWLDDVGVELWSDEAYMDDYE